MVAQLLRLKLQVLANMFRRSAWSAVGISVGLLYGLAFAALIFVVLAGLRLAPDVALIRDVVIVIGSVVVLGFIVAPLVFGTDDTLDPRRFALFGIPDRRLAAGLAVSSLIGVPALILGIALLGTVVTFSRSVGAVVLAAIAAAIAWGTCLLLGRVTTSVSAYALSTRRARDVAGLLGLFLVLLMSPVIFYLITVDWAREGLLVLERISGVLGWTPIGAVWAVPGDAASGAWGSAVAKLAIAAATLGLLWLAWVVLVARMMVTPGRAEPARVYLGLGWFDRVPRTALGAVMARSLTYWGRDSRYWASVLMIPFIPLVVLIPLLIAGVTDRTLMLLPVPVMAIFIGWVLHNDVALDSTAVWMHIASGANGVSDRLGRLIPVLLVSGIVVVIGSTICVVAYGDWSVFGSVIGVSGCLVLTGLGFGSYTSARIPYPAPKPGDSPFQHPQSSGTATALVQSVTLAGSVIVTIPAIVFAVLGLFVDPAWHEAALVLGLGLGSVVLITGVAAGSWTFSRRGPEILAAAIRA